MRNSGRIVEWHDDRGYGFVTVGDGGSRVFIHINSFRHGARRPIIGDLVSYELGRDAKGRANAVNARRRLEKRGPRRIFAALAKGAIGLCVLWGLWLASREGWVSTGAAAWCGAMSACAFVLYGIDKYEAVTGQWRTQESTLHLFDLLGGWPGALVAQAVFRHKHNKPTFQMFFFVTVLANVLVTAWLLADGNLARLERGLLRLVA